MKQRDMIFIKLHAPWYMGRGKHIYRTNWDLQLLFLQAHLRHLHWQMTAMGSLSFVCILAVIAARNLACNCTYVFADTIMPCLFMVLKHHLFLYCDLE